MSSPSAEPPAPPFSRVFFPSRRRRLVARDDEGEEAEEEVDVVELGLVLLDFGAAVLDKEEEEGGAARELRLPTLLRSLLRPPSDSGSEQGLRNGDLLSLSLRNTTAMEPPLPPPGPPAPRRSMPSFPEPTEAPVVLLTPSRTITDTLDCSLPLRMPLLSFLDLPERLDSFLPPFSTRSLSFATFLPRLAEGSTDEMGPEPEVAWVGESEERPLLLARREEEDDDSAWPVFFPVRDFFLGWWRPDLESALALGLRMGDCGGRAASGESSKEG